MPPTHQCAEAAEIAKPISSTQRVQMWIAVWIFALIAVHIQFRYCGRVAITALKLFEATIIVLCIRLWYEPPEHPAYEKLKHSIDMIYNLF